MYACSEAKSSVPSRAEDSPTAAVLDTKVPLEIIEVQTGTYLGEDDIVRLDDRYNRNSDD